MHDQSVSFMERIPVPIALLTLLLTVATGCALFGSRTVAPPPPPAPPPAETPVFMQWEQAPRLIDMVTPIYPDSARQAGLQGEVVLQIIVDEHGYVTAAEVVRATPPGIFEDAALRAILQWRFEPARAEGKPIKVRMGQRMDFSLRDRPVSPVPPPPLPAPRQEPPPPPLRVRSDTPIFLAWETAPKIIEAPAPVYPDSARQAGLEGKVVLVIVVDEQGRVIEAKVFRAEPPGVFEQAALEAVRKWRFEPALQRSKPIKVRMAQEVVFRLEEEPPRPPD
jgi:TonB family protein